VLPEPPAPPKAWLSTRVLSVRVRECGYEDQDYHDTLRADPVFKLLADCWGVGGLPVEEYRRQAGARSPG
jgi:hypothetical protein